jgi:hypothetical protein
MNIPYPPTQATPYNGQAIAAMVLGILGIIFGFIYLVIPILAIIFGGVAMGGQKKMGAKPSGMAIAGLVTGIVGASLWALIFLGAVTS